MFDVAMNQEGNQVQDGNGTEISEAEITANNGTEITESLIYFNYSVHFPKMNSPVHRG